MPSVGCHRIMQCCGRPPEGSHRPDKQVVLQACLHTDQEGGVDVLIDEVLMTVLALMIAFCWL